MDTLKTAAVVILLLAVLYGVYVVLNRPGTGLPDVSVSTDGTAPDSDLNIEIPGQAEPDGLEPFDPSQLPSAPPGPDAPDIEEGGSSIGVPPLVSYEPPAAMQQAPAPDSAKPESPWGGGYAPPETPPPGSDPNGSPYPPPSSPDSPDAAPPSRNLGAVNFQRDWQAAQRQINNGEFQQALQSLSKYYQSADLSPSQHEVLLDVLDALAGKVIYSTEPLMDEPLFLVRGESLPEIARRYNVPSQLISNINGLRDPQVLLNGKELKVIRGPFRAEVSLSQNQLTLFLGDLYAGRFDISVGDEPAEVGTYSVQHVPEGRNYYSADNRVNIPAGDPRNPYGAHFLDLGRGVSIHGSAAAGNSEHRGCISLAPRDARDVYNILSDGSTVTIRR